MKKYQKQDVMLKYTGHCQIFKVITIIYKIKKNNKTPNNIRLCRKVKQI